jgi:hypothetical protein
MRGAAVATIVGGRLLYRHPEYERLAAEKPGETTVK